MWGAVAIAMQSMQSGLTVLEFAADYFPKTSENSQKFPGRRARGLVITRLGGGATRGVVQPD